MSAFFAIYGTRKKECSSRAHYLVMPALRYKLVTAVEYTDRHDNLENIIHLIHSHARKVMRTYPKYTEWNSIELADKTIITNNKSMALAS